MGHGERRKRSRQLDAKERDSHRKYNKRTLQHNPVLAELKIQRGIARMQWERTIAERTEKPLTLDIYSGPIGLGASMVIGAEHLFAPGDFTTTIMIRPPFRIFTKSPQYRQFMEAIQRAFEQIFLA